MSDEERLYGICARGICHIDVQTRRWVGAIMALPMPTDPAAMPTRPLTRATIAETRLPLTLDTACCSGIAAILTSWSRGSSAVLSER